MKQLFSGYYLLSLMVCLRTTEVEPDPAALMTQAEPSLFAQVAAAGEGDLKHRSTHLNLPLQMLPTKGAFDFQLHVTCINLHTEHGKGQAL